MTSPTPTKGGMVRDLSFTMACLIVSSGSLAGFVFFVCASFGLLFPNEVHSHLSSTHAEKAHWKTSLYQGSFMPCLTFFCWFCLVQIQMDRSMQAKTHWSKPSCSMIVCILLSYLIPCEGRPAGGNPRHSCSMSHSFHERDAPMGKPSCVMTCIAFHQEGMVRDLSANPNKEAWYATSPTITTTKEAWYVTSPKVHLSAFLEAWEFTCPLITKSN